ASLVILNRALSHKRGQHGIICSPPSLSEGSWPYMTTVLVVDDEHTIADTLAVILNRAGFNASAVYSGSEAVEVAKSVKPDLIISDVAMPEMNGIEAMILVRSFLPTCKVLLFSGQASTVD